MLTSGGANYQVPSDGIRPWFYLKKSSFLTSNQNPNTSAIKSWVFPTLGEEKRLVLPGPFIAGKVSYLCCPKNQGFDGPGEICQHRPFPF